MIVYAISLLLSYLLSVNYQDAVGFVLILSIGIIHGANDLLIIKEFNRENSLKRRFLDLFYYLGFVFLGFAFFYFFPSIAIITFVIVSIYHFGEQHWESNMSYIEINKSKIFLPIIFHGSIFFLIIFLNNINVVNEVLGSFGIISLNDSILLAILISISILYTIVILYINKIRSFILNEIIFFILLFLLTINSSLIFGFAVYFIFFHSLLSIKDQISFIYKNKGKENIKKYITSAMPYFILALIFLTLFYLIVDVNSIDILPIIFTFLAAITFPHVIVIEKMYRNMK